ncbi:MAG: sugar ABC transporter permease, partial [Vallitaleaceae bacterium]|nr:sugar ABC transporter permease [Vallitaleaceae bacterium]
TSQDAFRITRNTIFLNTLFIIASTVCSVIFALLMFEISKKAFIKLYQTVAILPMFLSWVVVGAISYIFLEPNSGVINQVLITLGVEPISWYSDPEKWPAILTFINTWKGVGYGSIVYYAALMGINSEFFEAAEVDGANKLQRAWYISIPSLIPIITIMTILSIGNIFRADFGLFYNVTRNIGALYPSTDVIDTYVFRGLTKLGNIGMSAAVGLFQSAVGFFLILITNYVTKKIEPDNALF